MVQVDVKESGGLNPRIKEGTYPVRLAGIVEKMLEVKDETDPTKTQEVPRLEWVFGLRTNEGDKRFTALSSPTFSTKSKAFAFSKALRDGQPLEVGKKFDTDDLTGLYATAVVVDKIPTKADRLGQIQITSEIKNLSPISAAPDIAIEIEGLMDEDENIIDIDPEVQMSPPVVSPPVPPVPPTLSNKKAKK